MSKPINTDDSGDIKGEFRRFTVWNQALLLGVILVLLVAVLGWYWEGIMFKASTYQDLSRNVVEQGAKIDLILQKLDLTK